jgi:hypothetical protein
MPIYKVDIEGKGSYKVESDKPLSENEAYQHVLNSQQESSNSQEDSSSESMITPPKFNESTDIKPTVPNEGAGTGLLKAAGRGLMLGGASMLETEQQAANVLGKLIHQDVWQGYGQLAKKARDFVDQDMPRGEWSGGVVGRALESLFQAPSVVTQAEMLGGGMPGMAALGAIGGSQEGFGGAMTGAAKGLINGVLLNASNAIPVKGIAGVLTRGTAGAAVGGAMSALSGQDQTQVGADALSSGIMSSLSPQLFKKAETLASRGLDVAKDVARSTKAFEPFIKFADSIGQEGKSILAGVVSFMNPKRVTYDDAMHLFNNPEFASDKYIAAQKEIISPEYKKIVKNPEIQNKAVVIDKDIKDRLSSLDMFVGGGKSNVAEIISGRYGIDVEPINNVIKELTRNGKDLDLSELNKFMQENHGINLKKDFKNLNVNRNESSDLYRMSKSEREQLIEWHDRIMNSDEMTFNDVYKTVNEIDHNSKIFKSYIDTQHGVQPAPSPSKDFVRIAKQMRHVIMGETPGVNPENPNGSGLKKQFPVEGAVIDRYSDFKRAQQVNNAFKEIRPSFINVWGPMTFMHVLGLGSPELQAALVGTASPATVKFAVNLARNTTNVLKDSLRSRFK